MPRPNPWHSNAIAGYSFRCHGLASAYSPTTRIVSRNSQASCSLRCSNELHRADFSSVDCRRCPSSYNIPCAALAITALLPCSLLRSGCSTWDIPSVLSRANLRTAALPAHFVRIIAGCCVATCAFPHFPAHVLLPNSGSLRDSTRCKLYEDVEFEKVSWEPFETASNFSEISKQDGHWYPSFVASRSDAARIYFQSKR